MMDKSLDWRVVLLVVYCTILHYYMCWFVRSEPFAFQWGMFFLLLKLGVRPPVHWLGFVVG